MFNICFSFPVLIKFNRRFFSNKTFICYPDTNLYFSVQCHWPQKKIYFFLIIWYGTYNVRMQFFKTHNLQFIPNNGRNIRKKFTTILRKSSNNLKRKQRNECNFKYFQMPAIKGDTLALVSNHKLNLHHLVNIFKRRYDKIP